MLVPVRIKLVKVLLVACIHWMSVWVKPERCMLVQAIIRIKHTKYGVWGCYIQLLQTLLVNTEFSNTSNKLFFNLYILVLYNLTFCGLGGHHLS